MVVSILNMPRGRQWASLFQGSMITYSILVFTCCMVCFHINEVKSVPWFYVSLERTKSNEYDSTLSLSHCILKQDTLGKSGLKLNGKLHNI